MQEDNDYLLQIFGGLALALGGILITWMSYANAASSSRGGTYVVFWGIIVVGIVMFIKGIAKWFSEKD